MSGSYYIKRSAQGCAAYRQGIGLLDLSDAGSHDCTLAATAILVEHFGLGQEDTINLATGRGSSRSLQRVRRIAADLGEVFRSRIDSFELTPAQLDKLIAFQARCWLPDDHVWLKDPVHGWLAGHVLEVRLTRARILVYTVAATANGRAIGGCYAPGELHHRSKEGRPPWRG